MTDACKSRKEWRKLVKKLRRKKIRQKAAKLRCEKVIDLSYDSEDIEDEDGRRLRHIQWLRDEEEAQNKWNEKERLRKELEKEKDKARERIKQEWEMARKKKINQQQEEQKKQEDLNSRIETFIEGRGLVPQELCVVKETNPGRELCPFFSKVAACRFGASCSRNHVTPGISSILLIPNFYTHFSLYQTRSTEYDTDVHLEFEEDEMNRDFKEFFDDVVSELQLLGELKVVVVCKNSQPHLRGSVYVEYTTKRAALAAARALNARWYGGRQLSVLLVDVVDWGAAICGDYHRGRCPKGDECNFLHIFHNPRGRLLPKRNVVDRSMRSWRWSESPERTIPHRTKRSRSRERHKRSRRSHSRERKHNRKRSPSRLRCWYSSGKRSNEGAEPKSCNKRLSTPPSNGN